MVWKKMIILAPASNMVSHTGRCIELGKALKSTGHEIIGVGSRKYFRNPQIVREGEFGYYELPDFEQAQIDLENKKLALMVAKNRMLPSLNLEESYGLIIKLIVIMERLTSCLTPTAIPGMWEHTFSFPLGSEEQRVTIRRKRWKSSNQLYFSISLKNIVALERVKGTTLKKNEIELED